MNPCRNRNPIARPRSNSYTPLRRGRHARPDRPTPLTVINPDIYASCVRRHAQRAGRVRLAIR